MRENVVSFEMIMPSQGGSERDEQLEHLRDSFDRLASVLESISWNEGEIQSMITAIHDGITDDAGELAERLARNFPLIEARESDQQLWQEWSSGMSIVAIEETYNDPARHAATQLRMRLANIATKLGLQTSQYQ